MKEFLSPLRDERHRLRAVFGKETQGFPCGSSSPSSPRALSGERLPKLFPSPSDVERGRSLGGLALAGTAFLFSAAKQMLGIILKAEPQLCAYTKGSAI